MTKGIPISLNIFTRKIKRCFLLLIILNQIIGIYFLDTIKQLLLLLFWWPLESEESEICSIVLTALAKLQSRRGASRHPTLTGNCPGCNYIRWPCQSTNWFVVSPFHVLCGAWDTVATREVPLEKKVNIIFIIITFI